MGSGLDGEWAGIPWLGWGEQVERVLRLTAHYATLLLPGGLLGTALFHLSLIRQQRVVYLLVGPGRHPVRYSQAGRD